MPGYLKHPVLLFVNSQPYHCISVSSKTTILDPGPCPLDVHPSEWPKPKATGCIVQWTTEDRREHFAYVPFPEGKATAYRKDDSSIYIVVLENARLEDA